MARPSPRELEVIRSCPVTDHMLRVTLGGAALDDFPVEQESAYIKLLLPQPGDHPTLMRTYTIRHQRPREIDVDFALHESAGPASSWAASAQPGDRILVAGPGARKLIQPDADWFLLAGDMTALPALSVNLTELPRDAKGYAVIEVVSEADIQDLAKPDNLELHWVINPTPDPDGQPLLQRICELLWLEGQPAVWAACEFSSMRALRRYFKQQREIPRSHLYVSSYWKIGQSEDEHKIAKQQDARQSN